MSSPCSQAASFPAAVFYVVTVLVCVVVTCLDFVSLACDNQDTELPHSGVRELATKIATLLVVSLDVLLREKFDRYILCADAKLVCAISVNTMTV